THVLPQLRVDPTLATVRRALGYVVGSGDDRAMFRSLPVLLAAVAGVVLVLRDRASHAKRAVVLYGVAAFGLAISLVVVAAASYHPNRYVVPFLPLGAILIGPAVEGLRSRIAAWRRPRGFGLLIGSALVAALCLPGFALHLGWIASATRELPALQDAAAESITPGQVVAGPYSA